jgi:DNA-directed RNA polymerase subunit beta
MQRQAIPVINPHRPFIGTGMEKEIAKYSGTNVVAKHDGVITYIDSTLITMRREDGEMDSFDLEKFRRSNSSTCINQKAIVKVGEKVKAGQVIADGPATEQGELALGQNVTIAFMTWEGFNYEDAIVMSEKMVKENLFTSIHIEKYDVHCRDTAKGPEEFTNDVPGIKKAKLGQLDDRGIVIVGTKVEDGDILVGKITPKKDQETSAAIRLIQNLFSNNAKEGVNASLKVPHGGAGIVVDVQHFKQKSGDKLPDGVIETVRVYIAQKRNISEGDKMSGRHGNKGVISRIMAEEDMPYLADGTPVDILLNPMGVPSRMNIGQVFEVHLGYAASKLNQYISTSVFDGITEEEQLAIIKEANLPLDGKFTLYDGRTGEPFENKITVGTMYMIKLAHMVDDKLHARATGTYSLVTQQPLGGKAQFGGQRFGEMEVWALEAYGAANILQEILTYKSDDMVGRKTLYLNIIYGLELPKPGIPESFRVLQKELQALCIDICLFDEDGKQLDMKEIDKNIRDAQNQTFHDSRKYKIDLYSDLDREKIEKEELLEKTDSIKEEGVDDEQ